MRVSIITAAVIALSAGVADSETAQTPEEARAFTAKVAREARDEVDNLSVEKFRDTVPYVRRSESISSTATCRSATRSS